MSKHREVTVSWSGNAAWQGHLGGCMGCSSTAQVNVIRLRNSEVRMCAECSWIVKKHLRADRPADDKNPA